MDYLVQATITKYDRHDRSQITMQLPTFFLDSNILGIVDEIHATKIAESILNPFKDRNIAVYACAIKYSPEVENHD